MEFCPTCENRLILKKDKKETFLFCPKCSYKKEIENIPIINKNSKAEKEETIVVIGKKIKKLRTLPITSIICEKCGNNQAYVWQVQTRGTDESSTQFFRCTKCGYTSREYS